MQPIQTFGPDRSLRVRPAASSRIGALTITVAAHVIAVLVLLAGLAPHNLLTRDIAIAVSLPRLAVKAQSVLPPPTVVRTIDATQPPPPVVTIAPEASQAVMAAPTPSHSPPIDFQLPPMQLPSPPNSVAGGSNARATWETALLARVESTKYYAPAARAAKQQGVALIRFVMDRDGNVAAARVEKSSGFAVLDQAALSAVQRAVPLPKPPQEVPGEWLDLIVPVDFY